MNNNIHLYQMTCWQSSTGKWHVNDVKNLNGRSAKWYTPMRILGLSVDEYVTLLTETFHAKNLSYYQPTDYFGFVFEKERDAKAFCSYVNKKAKQMQYYCS